MICPQSGASQVTPPETTSLAMNTASITVPPTSTLYQIVDRGSSGTTANINFPAWTITNIYQGCGDFWKYEI